MAEIEKRMKAAVDVNDPEAMMRAWMPLGGQGFEQFPALPVRQRAPRRRRDAPQGRGQSRKVIFGMTDTIFALSSAPGRAGVAVLRVSGPAAGAVAARLGGALPAPRRAVLRMLTGADGSAIDAALVLWFAGPASFSGEDVVEFHVHGGRAVVERLLDEIAGVPGTAAGAARRSHRRASRTASSISPRPRR